MEFAHAASSKEIECLLRDFGRERGYETKSRSDVEDFGVSHIFTFSKDGHQIIVGNPFSAVQYRAGLYVMIGTPLNQSIVQDFRQIPLFLNKQKSCVQ
jgi:hypothetical protein